MASKVRLRFAPSPTGPLHVGGARTALFNWLFARGAGGVFLLRIEDTDRERSTRKALDDLQDGLRWLGIDWDEGPDVGGEYGPYFQSERQGLYQRQMERLLGGKDVYRCFCTAERIDALREELRSKKLTPQYDRRCRGVSPADAKARADRGESFTVRLRVPEGATVVPDIIKGDREIAHTEIDDLILVRSDGTPTYNFVAAIDDVEMMITHVIRGDDHFSNTPKQLLICRALGEAPPAYGHIPLILGKDKKPLSKRHGSTAVTEYRRRGYPRDALVNYLALLGWSYDDKTEIMSREELVERFSLDRVTKSGSIFDPEKLDWMSGEYIREMDLSQVIELILPHLLQAKYLQESEVDTKGPLLELLARAGQARIRHGSQMVEKVRYIFEEEITYDGKAEKNLRKRPEIPSWLQEFRDWLSGEEFGDPGTLEEGARGFAEKRGIKFGHLVHPTRAAITGTTEGPGLFEVMGLLGKEKTIARIDRAITHLAGPK